MFLIRSRIGIILISFKGANLYQIACCFTFFAILVNPSILFFQYFAVQATHTLNPLSSGGHL